VAPLRFGAGLKGKVLEAWAAGRAVLRRHFSVKQETAALAAAIAPPSRPAASVHRLGTGLIQER
jgi:hypothetical protein